MDLGRYFTLDEFTHSQAAARKGLKNSPGATELANLQALVEHVLDPLREAVGRPVRVSSGFRSVQVNRAIGGSASSQHTLGQAADFTVPGMTTQEVVDAVRALGLPFDQLIEEFGSWVHVSYGPRHRRQVLRARRTRAGTKYEVIP